MACAAEHDRDGSFPADGIAAADAAGLLTATVAPRYGGPGTGLAGTVTILRALGREDPSVALVAAMTLFTHAVQAAEGSWPEPLYAQVLAEAAERPVLLGGLRERLPPEREHVGVLAADPVGGLGRAAEVKRDPRLLHRADVGVEVLEPVVVAVVPEGRLGCPGLLEDVELLVGAVVTLVLGQVVTVAAAYAATWVPSGCEEL